MFSLDFFFNDNFVKYLYYLHLSEYQHLSFLFFTADFTIYAENNSSILCFWKNKSVKCRHQKEWKEGPMKAILYRINTFIVYKPS